MDYRPNLQRVIDLIESNLEDDVNLARLSGSLVIFVRQDRCHIRL